ncbi:MAG: RnfABCDGE type electron transport complex subunit D [Gammaproteobacteria bacterium]
MRELFDKLRPKFREYGEWPAWRASFELLDRFFYSSPALTQGRVHVRDASSTQRLLNHFVIASIPCWLIGMWNTGEQTNVAMQLTGTESLPGWRGELIALLNLSYDPASIGVCVLIGLLYFLPVFLTALVTGAFWEILFAQKRGKPIDEGLLFIAWIFSLIMTATVPLSQVALGMTVAMVLGKGIFGGSGRYLVNPSILGAAFLFFSYPALVFGPATWVPVPGYDEATTIELAIEEGGVAALTAVDYDWLQLFIGNQPGPMGMNSVLGCLLGAVYLILMGAASWRIMAGSFVGLAGTVFIMNQFGGDVLLAGVPWYWHVVLGGWAFGTVFIATDPVAAAVTNAGRWGFGLFVGFMVVIVRLTNPSYYDGVVFAILLACIFSPLIDYFVVERDIKRRQRRLEALDG